MKNEKLKILLLCNSYYPAIGGTEQECRNLAIQFTKDGNSCTVLSSYKDAFSAYERIDNIPVFRKIRGWHIYEATYIFSVFLSLFRLRKSFDHVICFGLKRFTAPAIIFARLFRKKVFFRIESPGSFNQTLNLKYGKLIYKISKLAHGVIVFTKEILSLLDRMDFPKTKITWIPNSVDTELYFPKNRAPDMPFTFCFAGRLVKIKGLDTFIHALSLLSGKTKAFKVLIIGDGTLKAALSKQAEEQGLTDRIHFIGSKDTVLPYYKQSDVFVLPSTSEGMPLAMLEAMSCGLCCVGSAVGGIKELLGKITNRDENRPYTICENGILFPPGDSVALQQALLNLMEDPELRKKLSGNARNLILENNSVVKTAGCYLDLINKQEQE